MTSASKGEPVNQLDRRREAARRRDEAGYEARRREIARAAAELFRDKGYRATTFNDIATELNLSRLNLYVYFASKEELLRECVSECAIEVADQVREVALTDGPATEKLARIMEVIMRSYQKHYPHAYVYMRDALDIPWADAAAWTEHRARNRMIQSLVHGVVEQGIDEGSIRGDVPADVVTLAVLGAVNWSHRWFQPGKSYTGDEVGRDFAALFLSGVSHPRTEPDDAP